MKIKDVEKEVGISAHSIRFYEEMGLIEIQRKKDSNYREFSEADVKKLKEIKLFRALGITMEEIKRYYHGKLTLAALMEHQIQELHANKEEMERKERLCDDIKNSHSPLVPYTLEKYEDVISHKSEALPYEQAGTLISAWNQEQFHKRRVLFLEVCLTPLVFLLSYGCVSFLWNLPATFATGTLVQDVHLPVVIICVILTALLVWSDYVVQKNFPGEFYEFREHGIYYLDKKDKKHFYRLALKGNIQDHYHYVAYEDIEVFKVWFTMIAKAPVNGGNVYRIDFILHTKQDEHIRIDTGVFGTSDEKVRLSAEILKEKAQNVVDPFHILDHLDDDAETFYQYLDDCWWKKEYARVGRTRKHKGM